MYLKRIKQIKKKSINLKLMYNNYEVLLVPIDISGDTVKLITKWRKIFWYAFSTKFTPTENRTRKWIKEQVIERSDKILFLIIVNNKKIGHIGFRNYDSSQNSVEIDNVLKSGKKYPQIMERILKYLIFWGFSDAKLSKILVKVFSDNHKAINLYERCGMLTTNSIPLEKRITEDGLEWRELDSTLKKGNPERFLSVLSITKNKI